MKSRTIHTALRIPDELLAELDAWCAAQRVQPTRTAAILEAIRDLIAPSDICDVYKVADIVEPHKKG